MTINSFGKSIDLVNFDDCKDTTSLVYKIVFSDNCFYIGMTTGSIEDRMHDHCKDSVKGNTLIDKKIKSCDSFKVLKLFQTKDVIKLRFSCKRIIQHYATKLLEIIEGSSNVKLTSNKIDTINEFMLNERFYF